MSDPTIRPGETPLAFSIRIIKAEAWDESRTVALEDVAYGRSTPNPYRDRTTNDAAEGGAETEETR